MSRSSGQHMRTCRYCGERYLLTNFMKRSGTWRNPEVARDADGNILSDTHLIACYRKSKEKA